MGLPAELSEVRGEPLFETGVGPMSLIALKAPETGVFSLQLAFETRTRSTCRATRSLCLGCLWGRWRRLKMMRSRLSVRGRRRRLARSH